MVGFTGGAVEAWESKPRELEEADSPVTPPMPLIVQEKRPEPWYVSILFFYGQYLTFSFKFAYRPRRSRHRGLHACWKDVHGGNVGSHD